MSRPKLHFNRRRRFLRDSLILFLSLLLLYICLDFPIPTADLARRATERRAFFGPSQVLCTLEEPLSWDRSYAVRWQDWYGVVSIPRNGLFWDTGSVDAVENDPSQALIPMTDQVMLFQNTPIVVFSNDPQHRPGGPGVPGGAGGWKPPADLRRGLVGQRLLCPGDPGFAHGHHLDLLQGLPPGRL